MLLFQMLFMGPDLTPLTQHTFFLLFSKGPACSVSVVYPGEDVWTVDVDVI